MPPEAVSACGAQPDVGVTPIVGNILTIFVAVPIQPVAEVPVIVQVVAVPGEAVTVAPAVVGATIKVMDLLSASTNLRDKLEANTKYFRAEMTKAGFDIVPGEHPIVPIMFGKYPDCSKLAVAFANRMLEEGIYVIAFSFPVVPKGKDRIRVQISAAHDVEHIDQAIAAFKKVGKELGMIKDSDCGCGCGCC